MKQNTDEWLEFRKKGLGASDAPIVMGVSPWTTPHELWEEKTGRRTRDVSNFATRRGHELEPVARAKYELETGIDMPETLAIHQEYPFLRASLDGFNKEKNIVLEIKCPGEEDHNLALNGQIPAKYYPQLQHQLLVSGADELHYYSFRNSSGVLIRVAPDRLYICDDLFPKLVAFWELVSTDTPPPLVDRDWKTVRDSDMKLKVQAWKVIKDNIDVLSEKEGELRKLILSGLEKHPRWKCDDVSVYSYERMGNVDYSKIPELVGVDLKPYRKKPSKVWTIK